MLILSANGTNMEKLLIASHNQGKIKEFKRLLVDWPFEIVSLDDVGIAENVEETGKTFEENARLKAEFYFKLSGLPTLSDDGGIEIDELNGEPGVKSRRWKGYEMTDQEMVDYTLERLNSVPPEKRSARLKCVLCLKFPDREAICAEGAIEGAITEKPEAELHAGYPFRCIFRITKFNKIYEAMTPEEYASVSQRVAALAKLRSLL